MLNIIKNLPEVTLEQSCLDPFLSSNSYSPHTQDAPSTAVDTGKGEVNKADSSPSL